MRLTCAATAVVHWRDGILAVYRSLRSIPCLPPTRRQVHAAGYAVGRSGQSRSGRFGSGCSRPSLLPEISAKMKFSGATGLPDSRRRSDNCPMCVMTSENGPCNNWSALIPCSGAFLSSSRDTSSKTSWKRSISSSILGNGSGQYVPPVKNVRAFVAHHTGHMPQNLLGRTDLVPC